MKRLFVIEYVFCFAIVVGALTFVSDYMAPAGSQRTGQGDACYCGGKMNVAPPDGKTFVCSKCGRSELNVTE